jgi:hypothetical protein
LFDPKFATAPNPSANCKIPAFVLAPPLPPVFSVFTSVSDGVPFKFSRNTSTSFPLVLFVLVITSMLSSTWKNASRSPCPFGMPASSLPAPGERANRSLGIRPRLPKSHAAGPKSSLVTKNKSHNRTVTFPLAIPNA